MPSRPVRSDDPNVTSAEAAEHCGITVARWHHLTAKLELSPAFKLPGSRGAMLWEPSTVDTVKAHIEVTA